MEVIVSINVFMQYFFIENKKAIIYLPNKHYFSTIKIYNIEFVHVNSHLQKDKMEVIFI